MGTRLRATTQPTVSLFIGTSVWSLALRRDAPPKVPEVERLRDALTGGLTPTKFLRVRISVQCAFLYQV